MNRVTLKRVPWEWSCKGCIFNYICLRPSYEGIFACDVDGEPIMWVQDDTDGWIDVNDALPVVLGKYGIMVLAAMFDSVYEEIQPGGGYAVTEMLFDGTDFLTLDYGFKDGHLSWVRSPPPVTHWMYKPEPPRRK